VEYLSPLNFVHLGLYLDTYLQQPNIDLDYKKLLF